MGLVAQAERHPSGKGSPQLHWKPGAGYAGTCPDPHVITEPNDERLAAAVQDHVTPADDLERLMHLLTGLTQQLTAGLADPKLGP